ncbi:hypothetical protein PFISCL1PPCAC_24379, partial [Pristionchus fissidentatus]
VRIAPLSPIKPPEGHKDVFDVKDMEKSSPVVVSESSKIFPSARFFMACLLCMCFISLSVATSNLSLSMVCMVRKTSNNTMEKQDNSSCPKKFVDDEGVSVVPCSESNKVDWTPTEQGFVFAAQNFGSLTMLLTGSHADKLNGKWCITVALVLLVISNAMIPLVATASVWWVFAFRVLAGVGDSFLFPSASSMISRWFPPKERPFAIGFVTGGRQIGSLLILPVAGVLCSNSSNGFGGWPAIFYLSAIVAVIFLLIWLIASADKPSKHCCVRAREEEYIARKIEEESLGKRTERGRPPWKEIFTSRPLIVSIFALVCHEYPLVIMLQLLPKYFSDVLQLSSTTNGLISALPIAVLWVSKTLSSSLASLLTANQKMGKTTSCKLFNLVASLGLGICVGVTPFMSSASDPAPAIIVLCLANAFAGLHTPGVQTALIQLAPAFSGIVTGLSFSVVAVFSIINKLLSNTILSTGSTDEWFIVFEISAVVALLPVIFFTLWGSAERQPWASKEKKPDPDAKSETLSENTTVVALAKFSMYLSHQVAPPKQ